VNQALGQGFADFITGLRTAFTSPMNSNGDTTSYLLSAAISAGVDNSISHRWTPRSTAGTSGIRLRRLVVHVH
jgi:hypothetical protein